MPEKHDLLIPFVHNPVQPDPAAVATHSASVGALFAVFMGWLPLFVALIPAVYYIILIFESKTVQKYLRRRRIRRARKRRLKSSQRQKSSDG
jgi:heme exporter protein D